MKRYHVIPSHVFHPHFTHGPLIISLCPLPPPQSSPACDNSAIKLQISMAVTLDQVLAAGTIDNFVSLTRQTMFNAYGNDRLCSKEFYRSSTVAVSRIMLGPTRRQLAAAVHASACSSLATSNLAVPPAQV